MNVVLVATFLLLSGGLVSSAAAKEYFVQSKGRKCEEGVVGHAIKDTGDLIGADCKKACTTLGYKYAGFGSYPIFKPGCIVFTGSWRLKNGDCLYNTGKIEDQDTEYIKTSCTEESRRVCTENVCIKGKCTGGNSCCSAANKCGPMEGDCDNDDDCKDGYACGTNNCPKWASFDDTDDCCVKAVKKSGSQWKGKLDSGEGDCDPGWCKKGLTCGVNNCRDMWRGKPEQSLFASNDDCCFSR